MISKSIKNLQKIKKSFLEAQNDMSKSRINRVIKPNILVFL